MREIKIARDFDREFERLINLAPECPINIVISVALENVADNYLRHRKETKEYKKLIKL